MRSLIFIIGFFLFSQNAIAQGDSILDFFDNIFNISGIIENENKERLQRELKYFAQNADDLIEIKKTATTEMLAYCNGNSDNKVAIENQINRFNKKVRQTVNNLESIRENVMFESDYDIMVDTIFTAVPYDEAIHLNLEPGCFLKRDTNYLTEDSLQRGLIRPHK